MMIHVLAQVHDIADPIPPDVGASTLLWGAPLVLLIVVLGPLVFWLMRTRRHAAPSPLEIIEQSIAELNSSARSGADISAVEVSLHLRQALVALLPNGAHLTPRELYECQSVDPIPGDLWKNFVSSLEKAEHLRFRQPDVQSTDAARTIADESVQLLRQMVTQLRAARQEDGK